MKTMVMNYVKSLDEVIPDATTENVIDKCNDIHEDVKTTLECMVGTVYMAGKTVKDSMELTAMVSKTCGKKAISSLKKSYENTATTITIRR